MEEANTNQDMLTTPLIGEIPQPQPESQPAAANLLTEEDNTATASSTMSVPLMAFAPTSTALLEPDNLSAATASSVLIEVGGDRPFENLPGDVGGSADAEAESGQTNEHRNSAVIRLPPISYNGSGRFVAQVVGCETHFGEDGDHTVYEMEVKDNETGITSIVFRRYSEFLVFFTKLAAKHPELLNEVKFPPKRWFGNNAEKVIQERISGFNILIRHLCMNQKYLNDTNFLDFIKSDMVMIKKALNYFRAKLYAYRQQKEENLNKEAVRLTEMKIKLLDQSLKRATDQVCLSITNRVRSRTVHTTRTARAPSETHAPQPVHAKEV